MSMQDPQDGIHGCRCMCRARGWPIPIDRAGRDLWWQEIARELVDGVAKARPSRGSDDSTVRECLPRSGVARVWNLQGDVLLERRLVPGACESPGRPWMVIDVRQPRLVQVQRLTEDALAIPHVAQAGELGRAQHDHP